MDPGGFGPVAEANADVQNIVEQVIINLLCKAYIIFTMQKRKENVLHRISKTQVPFP